METKGRATGQMNLRAKMQSEMASKALLKQAANYGLDYAEHIQQRPVFPTSNAMVNLEEFVEELPATPGDAEQILQDLHHLGSPASVATTSGRYFGFVTGAALPVTLASKWLTDIWDQNSALFLMSPVAAKLETVTEAWLRKLFGLPDQVVASFLSGSSMAIFCGLAAARFRICKNQGWDFNQKGHNGAPEIRIVAGQSAHGSVIKAAALLGFGIDNIEWVDCDDQGRLIASNLPPLDNNTIVLVQAGHVSTGSFDPINEICNTANRAGAWVHIDGAFGLWAGAVNKLSNLTAGLEKAQSWSVDAHKTLNAPYDNGILLCSDREALVSALQINGSYVNFSEHRDGMLYTPEMSRRARITELWAALKYLGRQGIDELVFGLHERAAQFASELSSADFNVLNDVVFNQVLVGFDWPDATTADFINQLQKSGECWVGGTKWANKSVVRISVCSWATTAEDVSRSVAAFVDARRRVTL